MLQFILRRLLYGIPVLLGVIVIIFFLFHALPGDPTRMLVGQRSDIGGVEAIRKDLGLDKPLGTQFLNYLNDISPLSVHNKVDEDNYWYLSKEKYSIYRTLFSISDELTIVVKKPYFRRSYQSRRPVTSIIAEAFPNTLILAFTAITFALLVGIALGALCAFYKDSFFDKFVLILSVGGMSVPSFFAAILVAWVFAFLLGDITGLNLFGNLYSVDPMGKGEYIELKNLILPAFTLGIRPLAVIIELTRNSFLDTLGSDFVRTARAKGVSETNVYVGHVMKNALNPVITSASNWLASLFAGAVFVEFIFDWKGIGYVVVSALEQYDLPVVMGCILFISCIFVVLNIIVDILYAYLDPRIRLN
jgi:peptide/nickel transport system permease protein